MKKILITIGIVLIILCFPFSKILVSLKNSDVLYSNDLKSGAYNVNVTSNSSMFRIVSATLNVSENHMSALITLSGKGYGKLYMGTSEQAIKNAEENYILFKEDSNGKYTYEIPVEYLNKDIECCAWSIRKSKWYDRKIVFESSSLPENALITDNIIFIKIILSLIIIVISFVTNRKKEDG